MDIYKINSKDGNYIARELEKLRCSKKRGKIAVKCNQLNSEHVKRLRNLFLLEKGIVNVFNDASEYYLNISSDSMALSIEYNNCYIIYTLNRGNDWKVIDLEICDKEYHEEIIHNQQKEADLADAISFLTIFSYSYTYGYDNVFTIQKPKELFSTIGDILSQNKVTANEFGVDAKVVNLISSYTMRHDFVSHVNSSL